MNRPGDPDSVRRARGREIALRGRIMPIAGGWAVRSPRTPQGHIVKHTASGHLNCSCEDFEERNAACKHIFAVIDHRAGVRRGDVASELPKVRRLYSQDWPAYNEYQAREGEWFPKLAHDLCGLINYEPEGPHLGRPRIGLRDSLFSALMKVYSNLSARRCMADVRAAGAEGFLDHTPSYNAIIAFIQDEEVTPILNRLIAASCTPLKALEHDFAVDATGFGTRRYYHHRGHKREEYEKEAVIKLHASIGVKTHIIARARVTPGVVNDSLEFADLVKATKHLFELDDLCADKAYLSIASFELADELGANPYISFKKNSRQQKKAAVWNRMYHYFHPRREEFLQHYHKRSNAESAFSSIKRKFTDFLRNKTFPAQRNEVLLKVLAYNITCVTQAMYELGVDPNFQMPPALPSRDGDTAIAGKWRLL